MEVQNSIYDNHIYVSYNPTSGSPNLQAVNSQLQHENTMMRREVADLSVKNKNLEKQLDLSKRDSLAQQASITILEAEVERLTNELQQKTAECMKWNLKEHLKKTCKQVSREFRLKMKAENDARRAQIHDESAANPDQESTSSSTKKSPPRKDANTKRDTPKTPKKKPIEETTEKSTKRGPYRKKTLKAIRLKFKWKKHDDPSAKKSYLEEVEAEEPEPEPGVQTIDKSQNVQDDTSSAYQPQGYTNVPSSSHQGQEDRPNPIQQALEEALRSPEISVTSKKQPRTTTTPLNDVGTPKKRRGGSRKGKKNKVPRPKTTYQCSFCQKLFKRRQMLENHERVHTGERPFKCTVCEKSYKSRVNLVNHFRIHTGERPFPCDQCDAKFKTNDHLKNHKRIHNDERPWECDLCGQKFHQQATLYNHKRTHRGESRHEARKSREDTLADVGMAQVMNYSHVVVPDGTSMMLLN